MTSEAVAAQPLIAVNHGTVNPTGLQPPPDVTPNVAPLPEMAIENSVTDGWRIEVTKRGLYFQWRERRRNGKSAYGGKFGLLSAERQAQYGQNKLKRSQYAQ